MDKINLRAYAKVNLYLEILGKYGDDYHNVETIYQLIDLYDEIDIVLLKEKNIKIICENPDVPCDSSNLAYKAAESLFKKTGSNAGVEIKINKNIPVAAGLGGGSSNAASVILGLNRLLKLNLKEEKLFEIGQDIGSDVSFFLLEKGNALGKGRGGELEVLKGIPRFWYIILSPPLKVLSKWAYTNFKLSLTKKKPGVKICVRSLNSGNINNIAGVLYNDLGPIVEGSHKEVREAKKIMKAEGIEAILISGSGPCIFGILQSRREAMRFKDRITKQLPGWRIFACCGRP